MEIKSSTKFCHYTSLANARNILSSECFFLSSYNKMNDLAEADLHADENQRVFVLSLSNSEALNIPAFYLYGGIDGKGCRIQFTEAKMKEILDGCSVSFVNKHMKKLKKTVNPSDYDVLYDWIYYISFNGYCEHRNESKPYAGFTSAVEELKKEKKHYFIKSPIWKYENEFRIVVVFRENIPYERIALNFRIKDNDRGISVKLGPETTQEEYRNLSDEFLDYGISNCKQSSDQKIRMGLIARNKELLKH